MKKMILNNVGKEVSLNFYKCGPLFGKIISYKDDMVKLRHIKLDGKWHTQEFHETWLQNVKPLSEANKQYVLGCIGSNI